MGSYLFLGSAVGIALLLEQTDFHRIVDYLAPLNTAFAALVWWRVQQLEKSVEKLEGRLYHVFRSGEED